MFGRPSWPANPETARLIGVQTQTSAFFERLTAVEQIHAFAKLYGVPAARGDEMLAAVGLSDKAGTRVERLSGGQAQRLAIACALVHDPQLVFLDEPTAGLDPQARRNLRELLRGINKQGRTVVLTTHYMEEAEALCHRVAIIDRGTILACGTPEALIQKADALSRITVQKGQLDADDLGRLFPEATVTEDDGRLVVGKKGTQIEMHYSAADRSSAATVRSVVESLVQGANVAATGQTPKFTGSETSVEDKSVKQIEYLAPGMLGWAIATGATFAAASTLVVWRQRKLTQRLTLSPVGVPAVVGARVAVSLGLALAQTLLFLGIAAAFFGLQLTGSWWLAVPLVLAATLAFLSVGLLAGATTRSVEAGNAVCNLVVIPMAFLSGSFVPLGFAPQWLQTASLVLHCGSSTRAFPTCSAETADSTPSPCRSRC